MIDRRAFVASTLALLAAPLAVEAQPAARDKDPPIGVLVPGSPSSLEVQRAVEVFAQGLRELGYVEGENIAIEARYAQGRLSVLPELAAELVGLSADVIVAGGDAAILAAKRTTRTIPLIMVGSSDPVDLRIVASFARPGGNITGLTLVSPDLGAKRLKLFEQLLPTPSRVAVLWNAGNPMNVLAWAAMQVAVARRSALTLHSHPVRGVYDVRNALAAMAAQRPDGLIVLADPLIRRDIERILDFAAVNGLPAMYEARADVEAGGLLGYGVNQRDLWRRAATYVDKILKGAKPADLPVEQPTKFELVINLKTANALGLTIPPSVLARADEVIE